jgi:hypothetical protein
MVVGQRDETGLPQCRAEWGTIPVRAFPNGRSNLAIICGGLWYESKRPGWYMDGGPRPADFAARFLMMWPGLDRCGTIGFRCVVDLE